jgi:hypothetical protein
VCKKRRNVVPRIDAVNKTAANAHARALLEGVEKKLGTIPNLLKTMANSPAALEAYLGFSGALAKAWLRTPLWAAWPVSATRKSPTAAALRRRTRRRRRRSRSLGR